MGYTEQVWANGGPGAVNGPRLTHMESGIKDASNRLDEAEAGITDLRSRSGVQINVKDFGAKGDGVTDDTAGLNAALTYAANLTHPCQVFIPAGKYIVSSSLRFQNGVSIVGEGFCRDMVYRRTTAIIASSTFTGSAIFLQDPGSGLVPDPNGGGGLVPDLSWHWGVIERLFIKGNGISGPHGIDPGWFGEGSLIRNVLVDNCNSGIYLTGPQASATLEAISVFGNRIGLNCNSISSTVRVFGLSGDNNINLLHVKGGYSTNVLILGLKGESYNAGTGDPLIDIDDLAGGMLTIVNGWADTNSARSAVIQINNPSNPGPLPRLTLIGFAGNTNYYTNLINDIYGGRTVPINYQNGHSLISYNTRIAALGDAGFTLGYARQLRGTVLGAATEFPLVSGGSDNGAKFYGGPGTGGVLFAHDPVGSYPAANKVVEWGTGNNPNLGFYGTTPITQQTVTGSRGSGAALADLLNKLAAVGLIVNSTSA